MSFLLWNVQYEMLLYRHVGSESGDLRDFLYINPVPNLNHMPHNVGVDLPAGQLQTFVTLLYFNYLSHPLLQNIMLLARWNSIKECSMLLWRGQCMLWLGSNISIE